MYNNENKELRPFIGVLFKIEKFEYFAPLSSPKLKHKKMRNMIDFFKIKDGEYGAVNFNNMIPVKENNYSLINLEKKVFNIEEQKYQKMLKQQLNWLNSNINQVCNKSFKLYNLYITGKLSKNIIERCCNFPLLEEKCDEYNSK